MVVVIFTPTKIQGKMVSGQAGKIMPLPKKYCPKEFLKIFLNKAQASLKI